MNLDFSKEQWEEEFTKIPKSPTEKCKIELISIRPNNSERVLPDVVELDNKLGVIGDNWSTRGSSKTPDGSSHPDMQVTLMNSRVIQLITGNKKYWSLAGDQFYVDLDLSTNNLPVGTQLQIGDAVIEVTAIPHTGCKKFSTRFGIGALQFVSTSQAREERLRGVNCKVIKPGIVKMNSPVIKLLN